MFMTKIFKKISKHFISSSFEIKSYYVQALYWSIIIRFCMIFLSFKKYRALLGKMQVLNNETYTDNTIELAKKVATIVVSLCNNTPWESKCLVQAVTCKQILLKKGIQTNLFLGINTNLDSKELKAHAWLKIGDVFLTGKHGHQQYKIVNFFG